jgi:putative DNA primase/helicase
MEAARKKALEDLEAWKVMDDWDFSAAFNDSIDYLINEYHFVTMIDNGEVFYYDSKKGIFVANGEHVLERRLETDYGEDLTNKQVAEYLGHVRRRTYKPRSIFNPSIEWIACKNCMINLLTEEAREISHKFLCTTQIPVWYDHGHGGGMGQIADFFRLAENRRGKIIKFLNEIMSPEDVEIFLDYLAYCLWREYKFNFWLLLHGAGFNGKSILFKLIEAFLGKENVSVRHWTDYYINDSMV